MMMIIIVNDKLNCTSNVGANEAHFNYFRSRLLVPIENGGDWQTQKESQVIGPNNKPENYRFLHSKECVIVV